MDIQSLLDFNTTVSQNRIVFSLTYNGKPITELRMLKTIDLVKTVLESLRKDEIENVCFVFIVDSFEMPSNMKLIKDFACTFHPYAEVIEKKLDFTIIQSKNAIFKAIFSILKLYYKPIKPLYMCESDESTEKCLMSNSERNQISNFSDMVKN